MAGYEGIVVVNYRLTRKLGEGGFGAVYLAEHTDLGRKAACKILHREFATQPDVVERFFREARSVCAIGHRAIIEIENFGRLPDGEPYYLMEYFPGQSLAERIARRPLGCDEARIVFEPIASALAAAHAKRIIHRDLKPENIMIREADGAIEEVKLLDFGIAKLAQDGDAVRSRSNVAMGTPAYMPPEQARDAKSVDERSDVYSFAATVYAALAGRAPFAADSIAGVLIKVQLERAAPLSQLARHVPASLASVIEQCMDKDPQRRPATIVAAWSAIRGALAEPPAARIEPQPSPGVAVTLAPDQPTVAPTLAPKHAAFPTTLGTAVGQTARPVATRRRWVVPVAAATVATAAIAIVVVMIGPGGSTTPSTDAERGKAVVSSVDPVPPSVPPPVPPLDSESIDPVVVDAAPAIDATIAAPSVDAAVAHVKVDPPKVPTNNTPVSISARSVTRISGVVPKVPNGPREIAARLCIDTDGKVTAAEVTTALDRPAAAEVKRALRGWRYSKYTTAGSARSACFSIAFANEAKAPIVTPPPATGECSVASFAAVYDAPAPSDGDVSAAMSRLQKCRAQLPKATFENIQRKLVSKM